MNHGFNVSGAWILENVHAKDIFGLKVTVLPTQKSTCGAFLESIAENYAHVENGKNVQIVKACIGVLDFAPLFSVKEAAPPALPAAGVVAGDQAAAPAGDDAVKVVVGKAADAVVDGLQIEL